MTKCLKGDSIVVDYKSTRKRGEKMTDAIELEISLKRTKTTKKILADKLNISLQSLYHKINNITEFKASEIVKICEVLNLSCEERDKIFFTK